MSLADLIIQESVIPALKVNSKKQLLQELSSKAAQATGLSEREIFDVILQRERLGSTASATGSPFRTASSIPSTPLSVSSLGLMNRSISRRWTTSRSISCSCYWPLRVPVPIISKHCRALARVLRDGDMVSKLRQTESSSAIYAFLTETPASNAA